MQKNGKKYKVIGTLMDAETGEAILVGEKPITADPKFKDQQMFFPEIGATAKDGKD